MRKNKTATLKERLDKHIELRTAVGGYALNRYGRSLNTRFGGEFGAALVKDIDSE